MAFANPRGPSLRGLSQYHRGWETEGAQHPSDHAESGGVHGRPSQGPVRAHEESPVKPASCESKFDRRSSIAPLMGGVLVTAIAAAPASAQVVNFYHLDAIGNVRAVTNQATTAAQRAAVRGKPCVRCSGTSPRWLRGTRERLVASGTRRARSTWRGCETLRQFSLSAQPALGGKVQT